MRVRYSYSSRRTRRIEGTNKHNKPVPHIVKEVIRISDIILEVLDARFIEKTRNRGMEKLVEEQGKILVFIVNKADLVNIKELLNSKEMKGVRPYVLFSCTMLIGRKRLRDKIKIEVKKLKMRRQAHIGIIGYPNTGKSSLINILAGRRAAATAPQAGFTKGMHKIRFTKDILILDTPGVFPDEESVVLSSNDLKKHAEIGVQTFDKVKNPDFVVSELMKEHPGAFERCYGIDAQGDVEMLLEELGRRKGFLKKGNEVDIDRTARLVLKDWQEKKVLPK
jgi:ribosome biogenesis GTPase A